MIKVLEQAIEKVRALPEERQAFAAHMLEELVATGNEPYHLSDDERGAVREGLADLDAARIVSEADMATFWNRHQA